MATPPWLGHATWRETFCGGKLITLVVDTYRIRFAWVEVGEWIVL